MHVRLERRDGDRALDDLHRRSTIAVAVVVHLGNAIGVASVGRVVEEAHDRVEVAVGHRRLTTAAAIHSVHMLLLLLLELIGWRHVLMQVEQVEALHQILVVLLLLVVDRGGRLDHIVAGQ